MLLTPRQRRKAEQNLGLLHYFVGLQARRYRMPPDDQEALFDFMIPEYLRTIVKHDPAKGRLGNYLICILTRRFRQFQTYRYYSDQMYRDRLAAAPEKVLRPELNREFFLVECRKFGFTPLELQVIELLCNKVQKGELAQFLGLDMYEAYLYRQDLIERLQEYFATTDWHVEDFFRS